MPIGIQRWSSACAAIATGLVLAGAVPAAATTSPAPDQPAQPSPVQEPPVESDPLCAAESAYVLGDSLTDPRVGGAGKYVPGLLRKRGIRPYQHGQNGLSLWRTVAHRSQELLRSPQARKADVWIVALGTNDTPHVFRDNVRPLLRYAKGKQVVWINTSSPRSWKYGRSAPKNKFLARLARKHPNVRVVDFADLVSHRPRLMIGDHIHMTPRGYRWRAKLYVSPWRDCSSPAAGLGNHGSSR